MFMNIAEQSVTGADSLLVISVYAAGAIQICLIRFFFATLSVHEAV